MQLDSLKFLMKIKIIDSSIDTFFNPRLVPTLGTHKMAKHVLKVLSQTLQDI